VFFNFNAALDLNLLKLFQFMDSKTLKLNDPLRPLPPCLDGPEGRCMKRHGQIMQALRDVSQELVKRLPQRVKFARCLAALEEATDLRHATLSLLTSNGEELKVEALGNHVFADDHMETFRLGEGLLGAVLKSGEPLVISNLADEKKFQDRIHRRKDKGDMQVGFICVPIVVEEQTIGTLSVDSPSQDAVRLKETLTLMEIFSAMISHDVVMQRMVLHEHELAVAERERWESAAREVRPPNLVGDSSAMQEVYKRIAQVSVGDTTVLIRGETGTGKELVAAAIHQRSRRKNGPFIKVNCAALSESLLESELFGHEKGAFTGALYQRKGRIEEAEGGTLFLDEIGDFSPAIQVKMLRVLQEKEFERVGSNQTRKASVRILCATNVDLEEAVKDGSFRADLFYRINIFPVYVAPLRKRKTDILQLANFFVEKHAKNIGKNVRRLSTPAINMLTAYHWPGNVRELENCIEHAVLVTANETIKGQDLPPTLQFPELIETEEAISLKARVEVVERDCIVDALKRYRGNVTAAARELGITARMVRYKIENLGIPAPDNFKK
jgi:Nif-specific regulatory protein